MLRHPFRAGQMCIERTLCAIMLKLWVDVEHQLRHLAPVCSLCFRIEHSQISYNVLLVVYREDGIRRCNIGDVGISGWFLHAFVTERMILTARQPK
jgi:hypothetical protein